MSFDNQTYIELFYQEADEHLQMMTDALLDLEKDPSNADALGSVFRSAHTLKSSAAMVGFMHISEFTHKMEDVIGHIRDNRIPMDSGKVTLLFRAFDVLKTMMTQLQDEASEAKRNESKRHANEVLKLLGAVMDGGGAPAAPEAPKCAKLNEDVRVKVEEHRLAGERIYELDIRFNENAAMTSARAFLIVNNLMPMGVLIHSEPDILNDEEEIGRDFTLLLASAEPLDTVKRAADVGDIEELKARDVTDADQFDLGGGDEPESAVPAGAPDPAADGGADAPAAPTSFERREDRLKSQTVRVNIDKLDRLLNLTAEMVIQRGRAQELGQRLIAKYGKGGEEEELLDSILNQGNLLSQLQETIMEARMVPIGAVFTRFRRLVRDLAHSRGKKVNLVIEGEETELDKKIIDQLGDPLTHMIRNAMDHGLETPEERAEAGKREEGLLHLSAYHQGNTIVIKIRDDGRGMDAAKLAKKAVEKQLITPEEAQSLSEREILHLIFRAGFSTAKEVTDISGRGVGMDVVRRAIEQIGGSIDIETETGGGSTFYMKVPLTLAIIQALLVESGRELFALPISSVAETIRISNGDIHTVKGQGQVVRLRDRVIPLLDLRRVMRQEHSEGQRDRVYVCVVHHGQSFAGLIVDRMVNEQEIVIKSLKGDLTSADYIAGASILGDGRVILILDTAALVDISLGRVA